MTFSDIFFAGQDISAQFKAAVAVATERRRFLHRNPQIAYEETVASGLVQDALRKLGLTFRVIEILNPETQTMSRTGIVVDIEGLPSPDNRTMLFRGDMDALPNTELTNLPHASEILGRMHACGHDGHTAMLLAVVEILAQNRDKFRGRVRALFQPAEELGARGARGMINGGALSGMNPQRDLLIAYHNDPSRLLGTVATNSGAIMAAADYFAVTITGKGGHVGLPDQFLNPLTAAKDFLNGIESIRARVNRDNVMISLEVTQFESSKGAISAVPEAATLGGSLRTFDPVLRKRLQGEIGDVCQKIKGAGYQVDLDYKTGTDPTINAPDVSNFVTKVAGSLFGKENVDSDCLRAYTAEDFGRYGLDDPENPNHKPHPISFVWVGQGTGDPKSPHDQMLHSCYYDFNDRLIPNVLALTLKLVEEGLPVEGPSAYPRFEI